MCIRDRHKAFQRGEATGAGKVYISGAIAHYDMNERKEAFSRAEEKLSTTTIRSTDQINKLNLNLVCSGDLREFTCTNTVI